MILLDTHALIWWVDGSDRLSEAARRAIAKERAQGSILVSSVSVWEIAVLVRRGRLGIKVDVATWLAAVGEAFAVDFVPLDNDIAVESTQLPGEFHRDPADRFIVATARKRGTSLVTADEQIRRYPHVDTIW